MQYAEPRSDLFGVDDDVGAIRPLISAIKASVVSSRLPIPILKGAVPPAVLPLEISKTFVGRLQRQDLSTRGKIKLALRSWGELPAGCAQPQLLPSRIVAQRIEREK